MTLWTANEAAAATKGEARGDWTATGVSIDTRSLQPGDLFVALRDVRDGHEFVADALAKGAAAAMVSSVPHNVPADAPLLIVDDVLRGLEDLGRAARARTQAKVIAVTGSVGKTSTKDMLHVVLSAQGATHAAEKSYNNHWGVPLTLARMPKDTEYAVLEIGMNHPGEIAPLSKLARPDVAVITTVGPVHLEAFESVAAIAEEKASIFDGLKEGGLAVYNNDLDVSPILTQAASRPQIRHLCFGEDRNCDWHLISCQMQDGRIVGEFSHQGHNILFKIAAAGRHFALNSVAVMAAVDGVGADLGLAVLALAKWSPQEGRGKQIRLQLDPINDDLAIALFDDAYNANPSSVFAALSVLADSKPPLKSGQRIAILGDMKELGKTSGALHAGLAEHPGLNRVSTIHCVGPMMRALYDALPEAKRGKWAETAQELAAQPSQLVGAGDCVMVKGSLSMGMAQIVDAIRSLGLEVDGKPEGHP